MDTSHRNNVPLCEDDDDLWYWGYSIFVPHIPNTRAYPYVSRIVGPDPKYRFARKFLQYQWPPKTPKGRRFDVELPGDGVYEVGIKRWNADKTLLLERQGYYTVSEAVCLEMFQPMRNDIELLALCSYFAQAAELLSQQDVNDGEVLSLTLNSIYALCKLKRPQMLVKAAFELRMMVIAGFSPMVDGCAVCGSETPDRFDVAGGMAVCAGCSAPGSLRLPLSPASLAAMQHITTCEAKRLFSFNLLPEALKELSDIAETYFLTQLERGFYTLDFYKSLRLMAVHNPENPQ